MAEASVTFSELLRSLRASARLTQEELASAANQALETFQRIGAADAPGLQAELDALTHSGARNAQSDDSSQPRGGLLASQLPGDL